MQMYQKSNSKVNFKIKSQFQNQKSISKSKINFKIKNQFQNQKTLIKDLHSKIYSPLVNSPVIKSTTLLKS
jgi:hypothetical protein